MYPCKKKDENEKKKLLYFRVFYEFHDMYTYIFIRKGEGCSRDKETLLK